MNGANAGAAVLQNNPTFQTVYPNKVFDYMACGRPTILAIDGIARQLVCEEARAGVFAEPENGTAIASAIRYLADNPVLCEEMGARGYEWVMANASRRTLACVISSSWPNRSWLIGWQNRYILHRENQTS